MPPPLEGIIARRVLVNFWADPAVVQRWVPEPFQVSVQNGCAVVGVCLIRLENLRPKGLPAILGMSSENMAHRVAIWYPRAGGTREGVYIWRRETDQAIISLLGGKLFPGVHRHATFGVEEGGGAMTIEVRTEGRDADVWFGAHDAACWTPTPLFRTFAEASRFFESGDCGFSCSGSSGVLEGMRLRVGCWEMTPLEVHGVRAAFHEDPHRFPSGSVIFDCGLLMRGIPHQWHELADVPGFASIR
jgi:hypothetical protein